MLYMYIASYQTLNITLKLLVLSTFSIAQC